MRSSNDEGLLECLHRVIGNCKDCIRDFDTSHHPNNYDCPKYREVRIVILNIKKGPTDIQSVVRIQTQSSHYYPSYNS